MHQIKCLTSCLDSEIVDQFLQLDLTSLAIFDQLIFTIQAKFCKKIGILRS